tara:strand:- start:1018 stop:1236 length:219 start_codon:yes stop_codon:yes gene_type:complete
VVDVSGPRIISEAVYQERLAEKSGKTVNDQRANDLETMFVCWFYGIGNSRQTPERKHVILMEPGKERTRWLG